MTGYSLLIQIQRFPAGGDLTAQIQENSPSEISQPESGSEHYLSELTTHDVDGLSMSERSSTDSSEDNHDQVSDDDGVSITLEHEDLEPNKDNRIGNSNSDSDGKSNNGAIGKNTEQDGGDEGEDEDESDDGDLASKAPLPGTLSLTEDFQLDSSLTSIPPAKHPFSGRPVRAAVWKRSQALKDLDVCYFGLRVAEAERTQNHSVECSRQDCETGWVSIIQSD